MRQLGRSVTDLDETMTQFKDKHPLFTNKSMRETSAIIQETLTACEEAETKLSRDILLDSGEKERLKNQINQIKRPLETINNRTQPEPDDSKLINDAKKELTKLKKDPAYQQISQTAKTKQNQKKKGEKEKEQAVSTAKQGDNPERGFIRNLNIGINLDQLDEGQVNVETFDESHERIDRDINSLTDFESALDNLENLYDELQYGFDDYDSEKLEELGELIEKGKQDLERVKSSEQVDDEAGELESNLKTHLQNAKSKMDELGFLKGAREQNGIVNSCFESFNAIYSDVCDNPKDDFQFKHG